MGRRPGNNCTLIKSNPVFVNEEELIRQIEMRPALYGRSRKAGLRHLMWESVSEAVGASVEDCQKRWRSLRDAYVKHYKGHVKRKRKWVFFDQMSFLAAQLESENSTLNDLQFDDDECTKTEVNFQEGIEENEHELTAEKLIKIIDESASNEMRMNLPKNADSTVSTESIDGSLSQEIGMNLSHDADSADCAENDAQIENETEKPKLDTDEHFMLSCASILRRLTAQKNSLARLKIQQILYEIEFG